LAERAVRREKSNHRGQTEGMGVIAQNFFAVTGLDKQRKPVLQTKRTLKLRANKSTSGSIK